MIFKDHLKTETRFFDKLEEIGFLRPKTKKLNHKEFENIKTILFGTNVIPKPVPVPSGEELLKNLTKEQKTIAQYDGKEMLIKGVAGSGKTYTLIANAIIKSKTDSSILFITFNKALNKKIQSDWEKYFSDDNDKGGNVKIINFHRWAWKPYFNLIKGSGDALKDDYKRRIFIGKAIDKIKGTKRIKRFDNKQRENLDFLLDEFDFIKGKYILSFEEYIGADRSGRGEKRLNNKDKEFIFELLGKYEEIKEEEDLFEFVDFGFNLIEKSEELKKYDYVYVDEAQDLHQVELQLLRK